MNMAPTMEFPAGWCMVKALDRFFGDRMLSDVTGDTRRAYASQRTTDVAARRELEDLRAAINHHRREGLCNKVVEVVLPPERPCRKRWLTRSEAARLIWSAWRYREIQKGKPTDRRSRQRVARFILVAVYTGTRASAVCGAALRSTVGHGWIDLERGVFYRRPAGRRENKKRQPPVPLPDELLAHLWL
jgi:integrase